MPDQRPRKTDQPAFVLREVQPALLGLMDGSVSTLAPIFAAAGLTGRPLSAFFVGLRGLARAHRRVLIEGVPP
jgi:hypothetical protein